jgi:[acyl-carrier-protein] S-malonyltransferase
MTLTFGNTHQTAFLFPGQGAQAVGMGLELYDNSKAGKEVFDEVDEALGRPLSKILFEGPEAELKDTVNAQPGIMTVSLACVQAMKETIGEENIPLPLYMAGHSLGEYTALAAAGVMSIKDTALLVQRRGELMQDACDANPGTMAAILGLDEVTLEEIVLECGTFISNINTQEQIVISGEKKAVVRAMDMASARGAKKVIPLKVGGAFHSGLMEPAKAGLIEAVANVDFFAPNVPIVGNCSAKPLTKPDEIRNELITQISGCVQWKGSVDFMIKSGVTNFLEIGPGRTLSGMVKRIDRNANTSNLSDLDSIRALTAS